MTSFAIGVPEVQQRAVHRRRQHVDHECRVLSLQDDAQHAGVRRR